MSVETDFLLAQQMLQSGQFKRALKIAKSLARAAPNSPTPANVAGIALSQMGKHQEALAQFKKAMQIAPQFHDALKNMCQTLLAMGRPDAALPRLEKLVRLTPKDPAAWFLLAQSFAQTGDNSQALAATDTLIKLSPQDTLGYKYRARLRLGWGNTCDALEDFRKALRINPDDVDVLTEMSLPLARQLQTQEALEVVQRAVRIDPNAVNARMRLATQLVEMGQADQAIEHYRQILDRDPGHAFAIERLCQIVPRSELAGMEQTARKALGRAPKRSEASASLNFALSLIAEASGERSKANASLAAANRDLAVLMPYDAAADRALTDKLLARFSEPDRRNHELQQAQKAIYVVGLPRSGTTLAEAILGAHPDVVALGERGMPGALLQSVINQDLPFDDDAIERFVTEDSRQLPDAARGKQAYVDKMPENYRLIGFLKTACPDCCVINLQRDPRDVALSMWKSHFSGAALSYTYDLKAMAHRFNLYARTMEHWRNVYPGEILDIAYEDMVGDVEAMSKTLADFCNLNWVSNMARPDLSAEQVLTLSATQLRQPVHTRSIGKWRERAEILQPFIDGLNPDLWPLAADCDN